MEHPDAVGNSGFRELRSLQLEAWNISKRQTHIPADFSKERKRGSVEVERIHGEVLIPFQIDGKRLMRKRP